ncbi:uncharacterized protein [Melanerpes formicivorus]|uniref:uncharacterized protein isoform X2 n=1 Tax=Melanerpes formicivorus TaxID=211600 RepID=UPI00358F990B
MSTLLSAVEGASSASWNQPNRTVHNRSWHHSLEDGDYKWSDCEAGHFSGVAVTLLTCSCGLLGNGAALWLLCSRACRSPITTYVLNLAIANSTFLLSITIALVMFYTPECLCCRLGSQDVGTVLNIIILFAFTASLYLLVAFSAMGLLLKDLSREMTSSRISPAIHSLLQQAVFPWSTAKKQHLVWTSWHGLQCWEHASWNPPALSSPAFSQESSALELKCVTNSYLKNENAPFIPRSAALPDSG